ncbi:ATP phosphoribosyltransferase regulatory subunit [Swingsia samuiensis]|uniref:ATP phosphoribosyltransferase regulatory subunit n=1 Tax=Swingsia samuiensis TaxID=1293412 RepID=A0A4Y6UI68_9PROT|nr:ATP phosphoribosyltransferase regulatory subunit [Swingsia samuiensis]QDH17212.1 ATP phosphoribosyltransferase regulatory subunit [Swingsia samuiensis]
MSLYSERPSIALLPSGFADLLPGEAEAEARGIATVMETFSRYGYERVRPPLVEFEASLLSGSGSSLATQTFRLMDPETHRMMAIRPDMTTQIARIASVRLKDVARPLRLSYSGSCIVVGNQGREADRQISQAGIELIGPDSAQADAEVVALGAKALAALNIAGVSFDLSMPGMVLELVEQSIDPEHKDALLHALDRKDVSAVGELGGSIADILKAMLGATGPAEQALDKLANLEFSGSVLAHFERLRASVKAIRESAPQLHLTIDPVDFRGWQYHTGLCVTIFSTHSREELGRGGRYLAWDEPACGLTLRPQALLRAAPKGSVKLRCYVPAKLDDQQLSTLHDEGFATVSALDGAADPMVEAQRLRCTHIWKDGAISAL